MTRQELEKVREWASQKVAHGEDPPWAWYRYMQLKEATEAIIRGMDSTVTLTLPEVSQQEAARQGTSHLRLVDSDQPEIAQHHRDIDEVPLPM